MFPAILFGLLLLVGLILLAKWFVQTEPRQVLRVLFWTAGLLVVAAAVFLALTGRLGWAVAALGAALPWVAKGMRVLGFFNVLRGLLRGVGLGGGGLGAGGRGGPRSGRESEVRSKYLRMKLNHDNGEMTGEVLEGPSAGRLLHDLSDRALRALAQLVEDDADSRALLEAWLDRERPDWRRDGGATGGAGGAGSGGDSALSREDALAILGLEDPVDGEAIRAAYRRVMRQAHPDHGGSAWLAAKVNQARDLLLKAGNE